MSWLAASSDPVYTAQGKAIVASGKEVSSSLENTVPHVMQDQARSLELNPTELKNQYQADHSIYRQKLDKEAEKMFPQALQGQKRVLGMPKNITFELLLDENVKARARFPMRVQVYPHDTTDSIVFTVKISMASAITLSVE
jgi:hypothetical protein